MLVKVVEVLQVLQLLEGWRGDGGEPGGGRADVGGVAPLVGVLVGMVRRVVVVEVGLVGVRVGVEVSVGVHRHAGMVVVGRVNRVVAEVVGATTADLEN